LPRYLLLIAGLLLAGCVPPADPARFGAVEANLPPPVPGTARLYFYRLLEPYEITTGTDVYLNNRDIGYSRNGAVIYRDVPPGPYFVSVKTVGGYPNQFKDIVAQADQSWYFRIESLASLSSCTGMGACRRDTYIVAIVPEPASRAEMASLALAP